MWPATSKTVMVCPGTDARGSLPWRPRRPQTPPASPSQRVRRPPRRRRGRWTPRPTAPAPRSIPSAPTVEDQIRAGEQEASVVALQDALQPLGPGLSPDEHEQVAGVDALRLARR